MTLDGAMVHDRPVAPVLKVGHSQALNEPERADCAIVVVTYNSAYDIAGLLDSLPAAAAGLRIRTVVVDNGSTDGTLELVRSRPNVTCIEAGANVGYAGGINIGRLHSGEYSALLVLNPDAEFEADALAEMFAALEDPAVGIVVPMLLNSEGRIFPSLRREPTPMRAIGDGLLGRRVSHRPGWLSEMVWQERSYSHRHPVQLGDRRRAVDFRGLRPRRRVLGRAVLSLLGGDRLFCQSTRGGISGGLSAFSAGAPPGRRVGTVGRAHGASGGESGPVYGEAPSLAQVLPGGRDPARDAQVCEARPPRCPARCSAQV